MKRQEFIDLMERVAKRQSQGRACCFVFDYYDAFRTKQLFKKLMCMTMGNGGATTGYFLTINGDASMTPNGILYRQACLGLFREWVLEERLYRRL